MARTQSSPSFFSFDRLWHQHGAPNPTRKGVLVVDDEAAICGIVTEILTSAGYDVRQAHSGETALDVWAQSGAKTGLVLIDVVMPGMDGLTLLAALRKRDPDVALVLVSGRLDDDTRWLASESGCRFLAKPFEVAELIQLANDTLGSPPNV